MEGKYVYIVFLIAVVVLNIIILCKMAIIWRRATPDKHSESRALCMEYKAELIKAKKCTIEYDNDPIGFEKSKSRCIELHKKIRAIDEDILNRSRNSVNCLSGNYKPNYNCRRVGNYNINRLLSNLLTPKGDRHEFNCSCGRKLIVYTNVYDNSNTGMGSCECGARMYIN